MYIQGVKILIEAHLTKHQYEQSQRYFHFVCALSLRWVNMPEMATALGSPLVWATCAILLKKQPKILHKSFDFGTCQVKEDLSGQWVRGQPMLIGEPTYEKL